MSRSRVGLAVSLTPESAQPAALEVFGALQHGCMSMPDLNHHLFGL